MNQYSDIEPYRNGQELLWQGQPVKVVRVDPPIVDNHSSEPRYVVELRFPPRRHLVSNRIPVLHRELRTLE